MRWGRVLTVWLSIAIAESVHGTIRQLWIAPAIGDLRSRQVGVLVGSILVFVIASAAARWIGARTAAQQLRVGAVWVVLMVLFEFGVGTALGYSRERMVSDYDLSHGGFMGLGLLFMLGTPALAARARRLHEEDWPG